MISIRLASPELKVAGPSMLGIGCPTVTRYRSSLRQKCADHDACSHPARAGSLCAGHAQ